MLPKGWGGGGRVGVLNTDQFTLSGGGGTDSGKSDQDANRAKKPFSPYQSIRFPVASFSNLNK